MEYPILVQQSQELKALFTIIRDKNTNRNDFVFYSDRIIRILIEHAINYLPFTTKTIITPTGMRYNISFMNICDFILKYTNRFRISWKPAGN